jgi:hypothetical protein
MGCCGGGGGRGKSGRRNRKNLRLNVRKNLLLKKLAILPKKEDIQTEDDTENTEDK